MGGYTDTWVLYWRVQRCVYVQHSGFWIIFPMSFSPRSPTKRCPSCHYYGSFCTNRKLNTNCSPWVPQPSYYSKKCHNLATWASSEPCDMRCCSFPSAWLKNSIPFSEPGGNEDILLHTVHLLKWHQNKQWRKISLGNIISRIISWVCSKKKASWFENWEGKQSVGLWAGKKVLLGSLCCFTQCLAFCTLIPGINIFPGLPLQVKSASFEPER